MFALSVDGLTFRAAWMAGLAIVALALIGWRQPARPRAKMRRGRRDPADRTGPSTTPAGIAVDRLPTEPYQPPHLLRRLASVFASGGLAVVTGAVLAIVIAFATAIAVVTVTGLLGR